MDTKVKNILMAAAREYASVSDGGITVNNPNKYSSFRDGQDNAFQIIGKQLLSLQADNEKVNRLLHDLTPQGSEFYNNPEYCAKWIRENRLNEKISLTSIIAKLKADNEAFKQENTAKLGYNNHLEADNERLREALQDIKNMETSGSRFDILQIVNKALQNK